MGEIMQILSRENLREVTSKEPGKYKAIIIHEHNVPETILDIVDNCKESIVLGMDDIISDRVGKPTKEQLLKILESKDYDIVACKQGISRSAAVAYLLECRDKSPEEAVKLLDYKKHYPNELILKHYLDYLIESKAEQSYIDDFTKTTTDFYSKMAKHRNWTFRLVCKYFKE